MPDFAPGTSFRPVIPDSATQAKGVLLVSGKVYYELHKERLARGLNDKVALIRVEQLSPFPFQDLADALKPFVQSGARFSWVQEEARNQGAWTHVQQRMDAVFAMAGSDARLRYVGRAESAVPGVSGALHKRQWAAVVEEAFAGIE